MPNLSKKLLDKKVGELEGPSIIISLDPFSSIQDAVHTLLANGISGCPVRSAEYSSASSSTHVSHYCGLIDLIDIVAYFTRLYSEESGMGCSSGQVISSLSLWANTPENCARLQKANDKFNTKTVADILTDASLKIRFKQVPITATIQECLDLLGPGRNQRLLVTDDEFHLVNIITQTQLSQFIAKSLLDDDIFKESQALLDLELSSVLIDRKDPSNPSQMMKVPLVSADPDQMFTVKHDQLAIEAFSLMHSKHIGGVAIIHGVTGGLLGNISLRDLRSLVTIDGSFTNLTSTAFQYLNLIQKERLSNTSSLYIRQKHLEQLEQSLYDEELQIQDGAVAIAQKVLPAPPINTVFANVAQMISSHSSLPKTLTISSYDTIGYLLFTLTTHRVRRCYLTTGQLVAGGRLVQRPTAILTLSDLMDIFAGHASSFSF